MKLSTLTSLISILALIGCSTPSKPPVPAPPMPPGYKKVVRQKEQPKGATLLVPKRAVAPAPRALLLTTDYSASNALSIAIAGTNVIVSWPTNGNQYMLFSTATLVTNTNSFYGIYDNFRWVSNVTAIGERYVHVGAMTNNARFYRLQNVFRRIVLAWDYYDTNHPPEYSVTNAFEPTVNGFKIYWGNASRSYSNSQFYPRGSITNTTNTTYCGAVTNISVVLPWFFTATAVDTNGLESDQANEVSIYPYGR